MTKDIRLNIVADGYLFSTEVEVASTFTVPIDQLIVNITVPTGFSLVSAVPSLGTVDIVNEKWIINNLSPKESITGKFTFRIDDISDLPGEIEFSLSNPPVGEGPTFDNSTKINVDGASCEDLLSTCFGSFSPYYRRDKIATEELSIHVVSAGVYAVTATRTAPGKYAITVPATSKLESIYVEGDENSVDGSSSISLRMIDPSGNDIILVGEVMSKLTGIQAKAASNGHQFSHDLSTQGQAVTSIQNISFGASGFALLLKPVEKLN